jgi:uncharacterized protein YkwD
VVAIVISAVALAVSFALGPDHAVPARAAGDCTVPGADAALDYEEALMLTLINDYRAQNGRQPLKISYMLTRAAAWKSKDMAQNGYFAHDDTPTGRSWVGRIIDCGYNHPSVIGENIAAGYFYATTAFENWKASPGHNSNMLNANFTSIGIGRHTVSGIYGMKWTTVFGGFDDGWARASGEIAPVATADAGSSPGAGRASQTRRLDFGRMCDLLRDRRPELRRAICDRQR